MDDAQFLTVVEEILEVDPGTVGLDDSLSDLDWDSLATISFIADIDRLAGVTMDGQALAKAETPRDLLELVRAARGAGDR